MSTSTKTPAPVLKADVVYESFDRFVCGTSSCAGYTAVTTGINRDGVRLRKVDAEDVREWAKLDLGPLTCECGNVTATVTK